MNNSDLIDAEDMENEEPSKELEQWLENAINLFDEKHLGYKDFLSHKWLNIALQIPKPETIEESERIAWVRIHRLESFKDYLLTQRQMALQSVRGDGYRIVPPNEQAKYAAEVLVKGIGSATKKSNRLLDWTNISVLSSDERRRHVDTEIRIRSISDMFSRERRNILINIS